MANLCMYSIPHMSTINHFLHIHYFIVVHDTLLVMLSTCSPENVNNIFKANLMFGSVWDIFSQVLEYDALEFHVFVMVHTTKAAGRTSHFASSFGYLLHNPTIRGLFTAYIYTCGLAYFPLALIFNPEGSSDHSVSPTYYNFVCAIMSTRLLEPKMCILLYTCNGFPSIHGVPQFVASSVVIALVLVV